jgi:hypothetical protein
MLRRLIVSCMAIFTLTVCADASILPFLASPPVDLGGGQFAFNYDIGVSGDERLDPTATSGDSCFGGPCNPAGTFFTIYDISGFVSASASAPGWTESTQATGLTPFNIGIPDSGLPNVTFTYTGAVVDGPVDISGFQIISTVGGVMQGEFSSQATNNTTDLSGTTDFLFGSVSVPGSGVPEPAFAGVFLTVGLIGFGFARRRFGR